MEGLAGSLYVTTPRLVFITLPIVLSPDVKSVNADGPSELMTGGVSVPLWKVIVSDINKYCDHCFIFKYIYI